MAKITQKELEDLVSGLNRQLGRPEAPYTGETPNNGHFSLYGAYGGWQLVEFSGAGARTVSTGFRSKADMYDWIQAFLCGYHLKHKE